MRGVIKRVKTADAQNSCKNVWIRAQALEESIPDFAQVMKSRLNNKLVCYFLNDWKLSICMCVIEAATAAGERACFGALFSYGCKFYCSSAIYAELSSFTPAPTLVSHVSHSVGFHSAIALGRMDP